MWWEFGAVPSAGASSSAAAATEEPGGTNIPSFSAAPVGVVGTGGGRYQRHDRCDEDAEFLHVFDGDHAERHHGQQGEHRRRGPAPA